MQTVLPLGGPGGLGGHCGRVGGDCMTGLRDGCGNMPPPGTLAVKGDGVRWPRGVIGPRGRGGQPGITISPPACDQLPSGGCVNLKPQMQIIFQLNVEFGELSIPMNVLNNPRPTINQAENFDSNFTISI